MPPKKTAPSQQFNPTSIRFQSECNERATEAIESNYIEDFQANIFNRGLLGSLIVGSGLCLAGGVLYLLAQNFAK